VVGVYVDDLVITDSDCGDNKSFKEEMVVTFKMSDLILLHYYLNIEVKQSARRISLSPGGYAIKLLERCGLERGNLCQTPMEAHLKLTKQSMQPLVNATTYQSIVSSLGYLVNTRPDLEFVVGYVSCFLEEPREYHVAVVKQILLYVTGTSNWGLWFGRKKENKTLLIGFSDSNFVGDADTTQSTIGVIFLIANNPVTWQSMKQRVVAQFSCEFEYIAVANAMCQALWLARVLA
jgi:hypothetical protein